MAKDKDEDVYIYLEFNDTLPASTFANKVFLRVANIDEPNPLVQLNNQVFEGTYEDCIGTNVFFEEVEDPPPLTNIFQRETPISLRPFVTQTKILRLKTMKIQQLALINKDKTDYKNLNLNHDYQTVLDKLQRDILNLSDIEEKSEVVEELFQEPDVYMEEQSTKAPVQELITYSNLLGNESQSSKLTAKYERLKQLAQKPVKRITSNPSVTEPEPKYRNAYEIHNLEKQVCQMNDSFRSNSLPIAEKTFQGGVDQERSALKGLIPASIESNSILAPKEQSKVFHFDNFDCLSLPARYLILNEYINRIDQLIESSSNEELNEQDENDRTIKDYREIFRKLLVALEFHMGQTDLLEIKPKISNDRSEEEFVSYKYQPREDLLKSIESYNKEEWKIEKVFPISEPDSD